MTDDDYREFSRNWLAVASALKGDTPNDAGIEFAFHTLSPYPLEQISAALLEYARRSVYTPTPHDIIAIVQHSDGHPEPDEAWNIALQAMDENATVIWTQQIAEAKTAADPIYAEGDRVGARMAFKAAYESNLRDARDRGKAARWSITPGHDREERRQKVEQALADGRISHDQAAHFLPAPEHTGTSALPDALRGAMALPSHHDD